MGFFISARGYIADLKDSLAAKKAIVTSIVQDSGATLWPSPAGLAENICTGLGKSVGKGLSC